MSMAEDLLFEIGTEELPPLALQKLIQALRTGFAEGLKKANLTHGEIIEYASPRRLALWIKECATMQPDRTIERRGPAIKAAFDEHGQPTQAAKGFARSCGTTVDQLIRIETDKGAWLGYRIHEPGKPARDLLPGIAEQALAQLPIPKRMRWGSSDAQFVRPVHWLLFLHGETVVACTLLDVQASNTTLGHRFHHPEPITIAHPKEYAKLLQEQGHVIAHFDTRREHIRRQVEQAAETLGGCAQMDPALLDEVTALNEWPVAITGSFEEKYLSVPQEALILTMKKNQKYFHLVDAQGRLLNHFITIANIDSPKPELIREGNERVIRPRLADAMFFWEQDGKSRLIDHLDALKQVVFQHKLGSMYEKSLRVSKLAGWIAKHTGADIELAQRAGLLSRCDLMTQMVSEFADMQGIMGRYQALRDGEPQELALALEEFYLPRFSGDRLPQSPTGIAVSLAEKIDTLTGIFGIGMKPTGDKDPFALRRAALGALRILRRQALDLPLRDLLNNAIANLPETVDTDGLHLEVQHFLLERYKGLCIEEGISPELFEAVAAVEPATLPDFDARLHAVQVFSRLAEAESLASANKRIHNLLKKSTETITDTIDPALFQTEQEHRLHAAIQSAQQQIQPLLAQRQYEAVLTKLAELKPQVDAFFDDVMIMVDDAIIRQNRLALLKRLKALFLNVADISHLQ